MRRALVAALAVVLALAGLAEAKFGMSKTRVTLPRLQPPELVLPGESVAVKVTSADRRISDRQLAVVRDRVEQVLQAGGSLRVVEDAAKADATVVVQLDRLEARVEERVDTETRYVKVGERQEWDAKKNKYVKKDVYGNKEVSVRHDVARGRLDVRVEVEHGGDVRSADGVVEYQRDVKESERTPDEMRSEASLEEWLVEEAGLEAASKVAPSPDPVDALLAVDKPLKAGNAHAERGAFREALAAWEPLRLKGDEEAARLHNLGVAREALAYGMDPASPEHRAELDKAAELYGRARALDPGEKYFADPLDRIQTSLRYAETALRHAETRRAAAEKPAAKKPASSRATAPGPTRPASSAVRNGGFDAVLAPWVLDGRGAVKSGAFEARPAAQQPTLLAQPVDASLGKAAAAKLGLRYKVVSGEARIRFSAVYEDASGRSRTHVADVTAGEAPGAWSDWSTDLAAVRPKAARLSELRFEIDGGTVLLDDVALELR